MYHGYELSGLRFLLEAPHQTLDTVGLRLTEIRDRLGDRIRPDAAKGFRWYVFLRFDGGADGEEAHLVMRRRGGDWRTGYAVVPAWRALNWIVEVACVGCERSRGTLWA